MSTEGQLGSECHAECGAEEQPGCDVQGGDGCGIGLDCDEEVCVDAMN